MYYRDYARLTTIAVNKQPANIRYTLHKLYFETLQNSLRGGENFVIGRKM